MYLVLPTHEVLNNTMSPEMEPQNANSQRAFDPSHARGISTYMVKNPLEYALGALVYAVDMDGEFEEVEPGANIGMLHLPLNAMLRSVDGQHRRRALPQAISDLPQLADDHMAVVVYVEPDREKRKQMFSDLNWNARVVSKSVNVGFNTRDPFAKAINWLAQSHPLLAGRVEEETASIRKGSENLYTLGVLYDALRRYTVGVEGRVRDPGKYDPGVLLDEGKELFDLLLETRPELQRALDDPSATEDLRTHSILLNGTTLKMVAAALHTAKKRGYRLDEMRESLQKLDFSPQAALWQKCGFVAPGKTTPNSRNQEIRAAISALLDAIAPERVAA